MATYVACENKVFTLPKFNFIFGIYFDFGK